MQLKSRLKNPLVQQYILELLFPLLGYFFFDWSIWIIGVFYLIDHLVEQGLSIRRAFRIANYQKIAGFQAKLFGASFIFIVGYLTEIILLIYLLITSELDTKETLKEAFYSFAVDELWLLFPLILFAYYWKDQMTFYMPRRFVEYDAITYLRTNLVLNGFILILLTLFGFLWAIFIPLEFIAVIGFVLLKLSFDFTIKRSFQKKALLN